MEEIKVAVNKRTIECEIEQEFVQDFCKKVFEKCEYHAPKETGNAEEKKALDNIRAASKGVYVTFKQCVEAIDILVDKIKMDDAPYSAKSEFKNSIKEAINYAKLSYGVNYDREVRNRLGSSVLSPRIISPVTMRTGEFIGAVPTDSDVAENNGGTDEGEVSHFEKRIDKVENKEERGQLHSVREMFKEGLKSFSPADIKKMGHTTLELHKFYLALCDDIQDEHSFTMFLYLTLYVTFKYYLKFSTGVENSKDREGKKLESNIFIGLLLSLSIKILLEPEDGVRITFERLMGDNKYPATVTGTRERVFVLEHCEQVVFPKIHGALQLKMQYFASIFAEALKRTSGLGAKEQKNYREGTFVVLRAYFTGRVGKYVQGVDLLFSNEIKTACKILFPEAFQRTFRDDVTEGQDSIIVAFFDEYANRTKGRPGYTSVAKFIANLIRLEFDPLIKTVVTLKYICCIIDHVLEVGFLPSKFKESALIGNLIRLMSYFILKDAADIERYKNIQMNADKDRSFSPEERRTYLTKSRDFIEEQLKQLDPHDKIAVTRLFPMLLHVKIDRDLRQNTLETLLVYHMLVIAPTDENVSSFVDTLVGRKNLNDSRQLEIYPDLSAEIIESIGVEFSKRKDSASVKAYVEIQKRGLNINSRPQSFTEIPMKEGYRRLSFDRSE